VGYIRAKLQQLQAEARAGTAVGLAFTLAVAVLVAIVGDLATREPGDPFPWVPLLLFLLAALSVHLWARWRRRHDGVDPAEGP